MRNIEINSVDSNMSSAISKSLLDQYIIDFIEAAEKGDINTLKKLLKLIKNDPISQKQMIHAEEDRAFWQVTAKGYIEAMKLLIKCTQDNPEELKQMIHSGDDVAFWHATVNGHIEAMKLLIELTKNDPEALKKLLHAGKNGDIFWYTASNNHIEAMKLLANLAKNDPEELKQMIHSGDDGAFHEALLNNNLKIIKFLVILDPFYSWDQIGDEKTFHKIKPYLRIDIKELANFSIVCKDPLNVIFNLKIKSDEENNKPKKVAKVIPKEISLYILQFLSDGTTRQVESSIKTFMWDETGDKKTGFDYFTTYYEQNLIAFKDHQNDNMYLMGEETTDI